MTYLLYAREVISEIQREKLSGVKKELDKR